MKIYSINLKKTLLLVGVFSCIIFNQELFAQGCSQCKLLAEQGSEVEENSFGTTINFGILYLMLIPYFLLLFLFRKRIIGFFKSLFSH
jgi:hypothetical protein